VAEIIVIDPNNQVVEPQTRETEPEIVTIHREALEITDQKTDIDKEICCICEEELKETVPNGQRVKCDQCKKHYFHQKCIEAWCRKERTCPLCKKTSSSFDYLLKLHFLL